MISNMCDDREYVIKYFRGIERYRSRYLKIKPNSDEDVVMEKGLESDRQREILLSMLLSNHSIHDPFIQSSLRMMRDREVDDLLNLKLPISPAVYLMGIPDPTGLLKADEVYVGRHGEHNIQAGDNVCVARFPLVRSKAIQLFLVVGQHSKARQELDKYFGDMNGVVVFASGCTGEMHSQQRQNVSINECPVSCMNGDYDGDLYFITSHKEIVGALLEKRGSENDVKMEDECLRMKEISLHGPYDNSSNEISIVFDLPCSPGTDAPSPRQNRNDTSIVMPVIPSKIQPSTSQRLNRNNAGTNGVDGSSNNKVISLLKSCPENLTPEDLAIGFCVEFIYSMSPSMFISTFIEGKLGYSGKEAISNDVPSKESVGKWSSFWINAADKGGIDSSMASTYAELHDIALQCRKYPPFCTYSTILPSDSDTRLALSLQNSTYDHRSSPHYLMKEASKSFESSSVLGKLFNLSRSLCDGISLSFNGCPDVHAEGISSMDGIINTFIFSLDPDLRYAQSSDFIQLAQKLHDEFLAEKSVCNTSCAGAGGFRVTITNRSTTTPTPKCEIFTGSVSAVPTSLRILSDRFKRLFQEIAVSISSRLDRPVQSVQASLASALYEVSYLAATHALDSIKRQRRESEVLTNMRYNESKGVVKATNTDKSGAKYDGNHSSGGDFGDSGKKMRDFSISAECSKMCKAMSRSLTVPWSICGYVLNILKIEAIAKQRLEKDVQRTFNSGALPLVNGLTVDLLVAKNLDEIKLKPAMSLSFNLPPTLDSSHSQIENQNMNPQTIGTASSILPATTTDKIKRDKDKMQQLLFMEHKSTMGLLKDDGVLEKLLLST